MFVMCVLERERIQATVTEGRLVLRALSHTHVLKWDVGDLLSLLKFKIKV